MKPYYEHAGIQIFHGDCREILPTLQIDAIVTDPVWPNCEHVFPGVDAFALLAAALTPPMAKRVAIQLGMNSDPRFLLAVPSRFKFLRACYLDYVPCGYLGRLLRDADIAYIFGEPPPSRDGARVLPGRCMSINGKSDGNVKRSWGPHRGDVSVEIAALKHPASRSLRHVNWLVNWFTAPDDVVCDPFMGIGTTALASKKHNRQFVGIEIEEKYCEVAARRLSQEVFSFE